MYAKSLRIADLPKEGDPVLVVWHDRYRVGKVLKHLPQFYHRHITIVSVMSKQVIIDLVSGVVVAKKISSTVQHKRSVIIAGAINTPEISAALPINLPIVVQEFIKTTKLLEDNFEHPNIIKEGWKRVAMIAAFEVFLNAKLLYRIRPEDEKRFVQKATTKRFFHNYNKMQDKVKAL